MLSGRVFLNETKGSRKGSWFAKVLAVFFVSINVHCNSVAVAEEALPAAVQSAEAIRLDGQLAREMDDYYARYREFRRTLRQKHPKGEDRVAALEKWEKDHKAWSKDWDRRKKHLDTIWNWGAGGKPEVPRKKEDLTTARGRVTAAVRAIRRQEKGTGRMVEKIDRWMEEHKGLVDQAEAERAVVPAPESRVATTGTAAEVELGRAKHRLDRIRQELMEKGRQALKEAMEDPRSSYSIQRAVVEQKRERLMEESRQLDGNSTNQQ